MVVVAGFVALILNLLVVALQRWRIPGRGWAVAIVTIWTVLIFAGLLAAFGYPLVNGLTHFSQRLPSYVQSAEQADHPARRRRRPEREAGRDRGEDPGHQGGPGGNRDPHHHQAD